MKHWVTKEQPVEVTDLDAPSSTDFVNLNTVEASPKLPGTLDAPCRFAPAELFDYRSTLHPGRV